MPPKGASPVSTAYVTKDEVSRLLDLQRKILQESTEQIQQTQVAESKDINTRLGELIKSLEFAHNDIEDMKRRMNFLTRENEALNNKVTALTCENNQLKTDTEKMETRLDYLDDQSRRNNLRFCGIPETGGENWEQCQIRLTDILCNKLNVNPQFERVHRVGKPSDKQPRDIVAKFTSFRDRDAVFRDRRRFKGTKIFVNEDLCKGSQTARQQQMNDYHDARREGKTVYWNYRTLVIKPRTSGDSQGPGPTNMHQLPLRPGPQNMHQTPNHSPRGSHTPLRDPRYELPRPLQAAAQAHNNISSTLQNIQQPSPQSTENVEDINVPKDGASAMEDERSGGRPRRKPEYYHA